MDAGDRDLGRHGAAGLREGTPTGAGDERRAKLVGVAGGGELPVVAGAVVAEAAERFEHRPAGHGAGVVVAALDLVVGVAAAAVVARAEGGNDLQPLVDHPFHDAVGGDLVFDPRPDLVAVAHWDGRSTTVGPGTDQQTGVVLVGVDTPVVLEPAESLAEVEADDRAQRLLDVLLG